MATHSGHCIFCDIIQGAAEVSVCYEDTESIAFMDIQPVNAGHVLVVSRQHFESFLDLPKSLGTHLFEVAMKLEPVIRAVTKAELMDAAWPNATVEQSNLTVQVAALPGSHLGLPALVELLAEIPAAHARSHQDEVIDAASGRR